MSRRLVAVCVVCAIIVSCCQSVTVSQAVDLTDSGSSSTASSKRGCTLYQGGCEYKVAVVSKQCKPKGILELRTGEQKEDEKEDGANSHAGNDKHMLSSWWNEDVELPLKKLDDLESRLTKIMEELSVRSLRHIRQIRAELRLVASSLDKLKQQSSDGARLPQEVNKAACPPGFTTVSGWSFCYRFSSTNATWPEARERCTSLAANLLSIDTTKEAYTVDYVMRAVVANHKLVPDWWTSGAYIMHQRQWMWTSRHHVRPIGEQARWAAGAPREAAPQSTRCLLLRKTDQHEWLDAPCTERHHYICELSLTD